MSAAAQVRARAEIDLGAIERNCSRLRAELERDVALCAVVKADGYGHGAVAVAGAALAGGAARLAVASAVEAAELREAFPEADLLVLGALSAAELDLALGANAEIALWRPGFLELRPRPRRRPRCPPARPRQVRHRHGAPRRARP